eukprot:2927485-Amphidinium_carterae.1
MKLKCKIAMHELLSLTRHRGELNSGECRYGAACFDLVMSWRAAQQLGIEPFVVLFQLVSWTPYVKIMPITMAKA